MKARLLWGACALCALTAMTLTGCGPKKPAQKSQAESVQATPVDIIKATRGDIEDVQNLTGSIEAMREVNVTSEISGRVAWVGVEVGQRVSAGQPLVRLDAQLAQAGAAQSAAAAAAARARFDQSRVGLQLTDSQTLSALHQAEQSAETARTRLKQAKLNAALVHTRVDDGISQAQIALRSAQSRLADVKAGSRTQEIAQAQANLDAAKSAARLAKLTLERTQNLYRSGAVSQAQLDGAQADYEAATDRMRVADQALDLAREGARTEQVRLAELGVMQAQQTLTTAEAQSSQSEVADRDVRAAEIALDQAEEAVRLARSERRRVIASREDVRAAAAAAQQAAAGDVYSQTQVAKHVIYAPLAGVVAARGIEPGESASTSTLLVRLVAIKAVRVTAEASELQVAGLRVGQTGQITVDALTGKSFTGRITDIAPQNRQGQRIFSVRLMIPNESGLLRAGMFARVKLVTGMHKNAILVPRDTLVERGAMRVVYKVIDGKVKVTEVKMGATRDPEVEIVAGVKEGETLVLGGQSLLADGQEVKPQEAKTEGQSEPSAAPAQP
jgi:HlyD family secretion protein